jgi:hypothetical protein
MKKPSQVLRGLRGTNALTKSSYPILSKAATQTNTRKFPFWLKSAVARGGRCRARVIDKVRP